MYIYTHRWLHVTFRLTYLYLTFAYSKGQGHIHFTVNILRTISDLVEYYYCPYKLRLLTFKVLQGEAPSYTVELCKRVNTVESRSRLRSTAGGQLIVPRISTDFGKGRSPTPDRQRGTACLPNWDCHLLLRHSVQDWKLSSFVLPTALALKELFWHPALTLY